MTTILGLSGSLRKASFNSALLRASLDLAPDGVTVEIGSIADVPLYNADDEARDGLPAAVQILQQQLATADALLLATPEYNNGIPGVFKNALDWMSRGEGGTAFRGKPVAVIGASPGGFGTTLAQAHWLPILRTLGTRPWFGAKLMVSRAGAVIEDGELKDEKIRAQLRDFLAGFAASF
ncbi:NADPH-dependent FMN reductase [Amaricoccus macauensis]|uniref:NADPH-dependent FMN reductase n=1 Tax=Amaricoccus macauensis TaxID=57001 RepID=UPI003C7C7B9D